jgi:beta-ketodecanoyl-[acyl-carrier-protein] synthase
MTTGTAITGSGVHTPDYVITNEELCAAFNAWVGRENERRAAAGEAEPLAESSPEFIVRASGIQRRHVHDAAGILDPDRMCPNIPDRPAGELSVQAEYAVRAAQGALAAAGRHGEEVDLIIAAASSIQRPYPAIAVEVQEALGARGYAYDGLVGCSSATFSIQQATEAIRAGNATCALVVTPEIMTAQANWRDRDSHFLFGDAGTAVVIERLDRARPGAFEIVATRALSRYSTNIRNNGGFLNRCDPEHQFDADKLFHQQGRRVFKDVVPLASRFILDHLESAGVELDQTRRFWLHQANRNMNDLIAKRVLGREPTAEEAPLVIDEYANTAAAGSILAFHLHHDDLPAGAAGVICSFGAGYTIGSVIVRRL